MKRFRVYTAERVRVGNYLFSDTAKATAKKLGAGSSVTEEEVEVIDGCDCVTTPEHLVFNT
jgi:hypothetical protein